ncbi:hypothetical protein B0F90DRAFT_1819902 [Multifurca ochricompacta]|uniref:Uncharacterized protein n=1 Tax=Multifurca ochricompacta TaxID=376703 RepID=A0AAD4LZC9_9AGAM|nr:hypothetical protein B0F90DRAFT_1819902 [Multifurca ochricompacta]
MQSSRSSPLKETLRRVFPVLIGNSQPVSISSNPVPSVPISEGIDIGISGIETSLAVLKEGSALVGKIPYIGPIAGLLLQVLTIRGEVRQYKEEWKVVMRKVGRVAGLVVHVGELCQGHDLKENDLPSGLRAILYSLQSELPEIEAALKQCAKKKGFQELLLRKDMLQKVKQYDGELFNLLQTFHAELSLDIRFAQIVQDRKAIPAGSTENQFLIPAGKPITPQLFFGRDAELAQIIDMIFTHVGSRPARIAILGLGGYGKTTLARAVLAHHRVQEHFGNNRCFVACESVFSYGSLLIELAKSLGILDRGLDASWSHIHAALSADELILCIDNFEITELPRVTVLITMRGTERPAQTQWTQPPLAPLETLSLDAAKEVWKHITNSYDTFSEELIKAVDFVPLAVTLLAHLAQATLPELLLEEWKEKQIKLIKRGQVHKLSNLEHSIQLSIESGRMKATPSAKDLLGILSMLPDGIHIKQLKKFKEVLSILISYLAFVHEASLKDFYVTLAQAGGQPQGIEPQISVMLMLEVNNIKAMLLNLLKSDYNDQPALVNAILSFTYFHQIIGDFSEQLISESVRFVKMNNLAQSLLISCLHRWGCLCYSSYDTQNAKLRAQEAEKLCLSGSNANSPLHALVIIELGQIYIQQGTIHEAEPVFKKALTIYGAANDGLGQGNALMGLGQVYQRLHKLDEAEASYQKALEYHEAGKSFHGQGNGYKGLGEVQLRLNKLSEAETSFKRALECYKATNLVLEQGNTHLRLGEVYHRLGKYDDAESSFQKAFKFHKAANDAIWQGTDYNALGSIYLEMNKLDDAEAIYTKSANLYRAIAPSHADHGGALNGLGRVYMRRSQLEQAKSMFEKALEIHKRAQDLEWEKWDLDCLNDVLSKIGRPGQG